MPSRTLEDKVEDLTKLAATQGEQLRALDAALKTMAADCGTIYQQNVGRNEDQRSLVAKRDRRTHKMERRCQERQRRMGAQGLGCRSARHRGDIVLRFDLLPESLLFKNAIASSPDWVALNRVDTDHGVQVVQH